MTLSLYIARKFCFAFLGIFAVFLVIMALIDMVEQLRRFPDISFGAAAGLAFLNVPSSIYRILPLLIILATLVLFIGLARTSELVITRAAGRSALRTLVSPVLTAFLIGLLGVAVMNPLVAATSKAYDAAAETYRRGPGNVVSVSREGLWLRQGGTDGQTVIRAERSNPDGTELFGASFIGFATDSGPVTRIEAESAKLVTGAWELRGVKLWQFAPGTNAEALAQSLPAYRLPSELTREQIRDSFGTPSAIAIWELPAFIASLDRAGFSARQHRVWLQMELALPLLLSAMVLVGAGFTMRHTRFGKTGLMVLFALLSGFGLYFLRNFAQVLGENGQIPVILAAWSPPVAAVLLSLGLLLHLEDG